MLRGRILLEIDWKGQKVTATTIEIIPSGEIHRVQIAVVPFPVSFSLFSVNYTFDQT